MKIIKCIIPLFVVLISFTAHSQSKSFFSTRKGFTNAETDSLERADYLFDEGDYQIALPYYTQLNKSHPKDLSLLYKMGVCYLYKNDEHEKSIECFTKILEKNRKASDINYYLGRAYMLNYKFDEAIDCFNKYLGQKISKDRRAETEHYVENCNNGKKLMANPVDVKIENIGPPVNTEASEYVPVISSDESVLIFTYRGPKSTGGRQNIYNQPDPYGIFFEDVFSSNRVDGKWSDPQSLGTNINGVGHDACIALSSDGQKLFVYKNLTPGMGDIYISHLQGKEWSIPEPLKGDINTPNYWEGSITISADEKTVYFASERPGGYGGRDLYKATLQPDGSWRDTMNLGPGINTPYNDDAPFIHPDGTQLYFSSEGHNSMGGYDIFRVDLQLDGKWSEPVNVGYPINTTDDEKFYVLTADGKKGYYSSGKPGGYGQQDIYTVEPGVVGKKVVLTLLKGQVTHNDQPTEAEIIVTADSGKTQAVYKSNGATGKYLVNLPSGHDYKVTYKLNGYDDQIQTVEAKNIDSFSEKIIDIQFFDKAQLFLVDSTGKILKTATQTGFGSFIFDNLPPDKSCFFKLLPDDDTLLIKSVKIYVNGNNVPKKIIKRNGKLFRFEELESDKSNLEKLAEENTTLKLPKNLPNGNGTPPQTYDEYLAQYGDASAPDLEFMVQVAAYRSPEKFNIQKYSNLGKIDKSEGGDGITRFTAGGSFKTLKAADSQKKKAIKQGTADAFVYPLYEGKKISWKELMAANLYQNK